VGVLVASLVVLMGWFAWGGIDALLIAANRLSDAQGRPLR
jgi:hypothetical protein